MFNIGIEVAMYQSQKASLFSQGLFDLPQQILTDP